MFRVLPMTWWMLQSTPAIFVGWTPPGTHGFEILQCAAFAVEAQQLPFSRLPLSVSK